MNIKQIQEKLHSQSPSKFSDYDAAVLVPIYCDQFGEVESILLTQRAKHLRAHAAQVAFAGGKVDDVDDSIIMTAQREAFEEIGLLEKDCQFLGFLPDIESKNGLSVCSVVVKMQTKPPLILNSEEVESAFYFNAEVWLAGPSYQRLSRANKNGGEEYFQLPRFKFQSYDIWGMTAMILVQLLNLTTLAQWDVIKAEK